MHEMAKEPTFIRLSFFDSMQIWPDNIWPSSSIPCKSVFFWYAKVQVFCRRWFLLLLVHLRCRTNYGIVSRTLGFQAGNISGVFQKRYQTCVSILVTLAMQKILLATWRRIYRCFGVILRLRNAKCAKNARIAKKESGFNGCSANQAETLLNWECA